MSDDDIVIILRNAVSWRAPDEKALDADLLREDAHERQRLEKEYPWKE